MSNIKYPFKSQDVSSTGFGVREKPESDHIPDATKMVDVKPESDKNKYTMLPADPDGFIIFKMIYRKELRIIIYFGGYVKGNHPGGRGRSQRSRRNGRCSRGS